MNIYVQDAYLEFVYIHVLAAVALQLLVGLCQSACSLLASSACAHVGNVDQCDGWAESLQELKASPPSADMLQVPDPKPAC